MARVLEEEPKLDSPPPYKVLSHSRSDYAHARSASEPSRLAGDLSHHFYAHAHLSPKIEHRVFLLKEVVISASLIIAAALMLFALE